MIFQPSQDAADVCQSLLNHYSVRLTRQHAFAFLHDMLDIALMLFQTFNFKQKADCFGDNQQALDNHRQSL